MSKLELRNQSGEKVKDIKLNDNVFGIEPNDVVLHDAVVLAMANSRQGTHSTKTRAEVSGGRSSALTVPSKEQLYSIIPEACETGAAFSIK